MRKEEWRFIAGYEGLYMVSNYGRIKSLYNGKEKELKTKRVGKYYQVTLCVGGIRKYRYIHTLVAYAFPDICGAYFPGAEINHKDENPENNTAWNLEWCTRKYNINYGKHNENVSKALSVIVYQYDLNGKLVRKWSSAGEAGRNGYSKSCVCACCNGQLQTYRDCVWSHTPNELFPDY